MKKVSSGWLRYTLHPELSASKVMVHHTCNTCHGKSEDAGVLAGYVGTISAVDAWRKPAESQPPNASGELVLAASWGRFGRYLELAAPLIADS